MISLICAYKNIILVEPESMVVVTGMGDSNEKEAIGKLIYSLKVK